MNLRDLQYLVAVADTLHFGKAALACHVSQPTLSMQLKKLEEYLGVQLFERTNKKVQLTAIGADIAARARTTLDGAEQIRKLAKAAQNPLAGDVRLGIFPTLAPYLLPSLMPKLSAAFPLVNFLLIEEKTDVLIQMLDRSELDCALLAMPVHHATLEAKRVFDEPFTLAVARQHKLAKRKRVTLEDVRNEPVLLLEDGHCLREQALAVCHRIGVAESQSFRATSLETLRHMVAAGNAVTFIPELAVREDDSAVTYIPFATPAPMRRIGLHWRKTSARLPLFTALTRTIADSYPTP